MKNTQTYLKPPDVCIHLLLKWAFQSKQIRYKMWTFFFFTLLSRLDIKCGLFSFSPLLSWLIVKRPAPARMDLWRVLGERVLQPCEPFTLQKLNIKFGPPVKRWDDLPPPD